MSGDGLITVASSFSVRETVERLVGFATARGLTVFARVDHGDGAAKAGLALRPAELVIFGHPKGGTPLMQDRQTAGIDLPVKALAWEDADGKVWISYNSPAYLQARHGLPQELVQTIAAVEGLAATAAE